MNRSAAPILFRWLTALWAIYTIFAPPGLPSCWLERKPCEAHPHPDGHPERSHPHFYLVDDMQAAGTALPQQVTPAGLLLRLLQHISISTYLHRPASSSQPWLALADPPPPR
jgi:hypothetical protein